VLGRAGDIEGVLAGIAGGELGGLGLLALVGLVAGVINTMAGGGGLLVLPMLMSLGLSAGAANGTMRIGVIVQNTTSLLAFQRKREGDLRLVMRLLPTMVVGSIAGAWLATRLAEDLLRPIFGGVLVVWAIALVVRPGRFLEVPTEPRAPGLGSQIASLAIGLYGGFLQAGVGFPLLALLISGLGHPPVRANAIKVALVLGFTLVALPLFAAAGQLVWREAVVLAVGSLVGGWIGAAWQLREGGAKVVQWFVVAAVAISGAMMLLR
jgi:uncharacterized protein